MKQTHVVKKWGLVLILGFTVYFGFSQDAFSAGYKIPEQSSNSVGLAAAYVADAHGPDSAYFNPANMVWSAEGAAIETSLNYIYLPKVKFQGTILGSPVNASSKSEHFFLPNIHYISPKKGNARFGFSIVYPYGLSKRWNHPSQQLFAEEFTLETIELDLAVAFEVTKQVALGWGIRGVRSEGKVVRRGTLPGPASVSAEMEGHDFSTGYFLALSVRPIEHLSMAVTYRSKVEPKLEGDARLRFTGSPDYNGPAELDIVLPATFQVAAAYTYRRTVLEFVYEKTYWSAYRELDFEFASPQPGFFDAPIEKNYRDSDTYRLGLTYHYNPKLKLLFGFGYDEAPTPGETLNFELPDATSLIYSTGFKYQSSERLALAMAYITSQKRDRFFSNSDAFVSGEFKSSAHILNASLTYLF